jgi:hypothetical protein
VGTYSSIAIAAPILLFGEKNIDDGRGGSQDSGRAIAKNTGIKKREALAVTREAKPGLT